MKLTALFLLIPFLHVYANGFGQEKFSLHLDQVEAAKVFSHIQKESNYRFFYLQEDIRKLGKVSIHVADATVPEIMQKMLDNRLAFKILNDYLVVISPNELELQRQLELRGTVTDENGNPLEGASVKVKGQNIGITTQPDGSFSIVVDPQSVLEISMIGYQSVEVAVGGRKHINGIVLKRRETGLEEVVVVGYGTQKRLEITGAISSMSQEKIGIIKTAGGTTGDLLGGQISGLSFRSSGKPGSFANLNIRNMGTPLYVVDGFIADAGQFNELSPNDIESISVLKGPEASIYGSQAANGVIVVKTKDGKFNSPTRVALDLYYGWQNLTTFPRSSVDAADWLRYAAEAQINGVGSTSISPEDIEKWKFPEKNEFPSEFESFDWINFYLKKNNPLSSGHISVSGGDRKTKYYFSLSNTYDGGVIPEYTYRRTNGQMNIISKVKKFTFGLSTNFRIDDRTSPGASGVGDDWFSLVSIINTVPTVRPYANNNPDFINNIGIYNVWNGGAWFDKYVGRWKDNWWVAMITPSIKYDLPIKGLSIDGLYSYYYANNYTYGHRKSYDLYTYDPNTGDYNITGRSGADQQIRARSLTLRIRQRLELTYKKTIDRHDLTGLIGYERSSEDLKNQTIYNQPLVRNLDLVQVNSILSNGYNDSYSQEARVSYYGRVTYNYAQKYFLEFSGRADASFKFPPGHRWGYFPGASAGWRLTQEPFMKSIIGNGNSLSDLKLRIAYGLLGDDRSVPGFAYLPGYNYAVNDYILDGKLIKTSANAGVPVTNITWLKAKSFDVGLDFEFWNGKFSGTFDYFRRVRTGLLSGAYPVVIPSLIGYSLPLLNQDSDVKVGGDMTLNYNGKIGRNFDFRISGNFALTRQKYLQVKNVTFGGSWDEYRNSLENRWAGIYWGYQVEGRFKSIEEINHYPVNIDGKNNITLLPGDFIYKDVNGDGVINQYDMRPINGSSGDDNTPMYYGGFQFNFGWKGISLAANFSYAGGNWFGRYDGMVVPFWNNGNIFDSFLDRWHREDYRDPNSEWIPGKYPALRYNDRSISSYMGNSDFWTISMKYLRFRTLELSYNLPPKIISRIKGLDECRFYINGYNLFTLENNPGYMDVSIVAYNGIGYPARKSVSLGLKVVF